MELTEFISDHAQLYIDIYLISVGCLLVGVFGMASNVINFCILTRQGIKDCVSVCLLSLTFSDFFVALFVVAGSVCYCMAISHSEFYIDPLAVNSILAWIWGMWFDISMLTTAFISVERSLSVVFPFKFKNLVTFNRSLLVLTCIYGVTAAGYMTLFLSQGLSLQFDPKTNSTRVKLWVSKNRAQVEAISNISIHVVYGTICEIIVIASTYGLVSGLRRSNTFRSTSASADSNVLSLRNKNIVKMVTVLAAIFIVCNVVRLLFNYMRMAFPEIMLGKKLHNTFNTFLRIMFLCDTTGASVNIIVYLFCKPSFRKVFLSLFRKSSSAVGDKED